MAQGAQLEDTYSIGEVATMVGLSAHTIRAWERRFGVVSPARTPARQRRYRLEDVETLKRVKDIANARGLSLRLAAAAALGDLPELRPAMGATTDPPEAGGADAGHWRVVADLDPRLLLILDDRGRVFDCNISLARLAGQLRFELQGRRFSDLVDPYDRAKAVAIYRGTPQHRSGWELNLKTPGGAGLFRFECTPFRFGDTWLVACAGEDVSLTV